MKTSSKFAMGVAVIAASALAPWLVGLAQQEASQPAPLQLAVNKRKFDHIGNVGPAQTQREAGRAGAPQGKGPAADVAATPRPEKGRDYFLKIDGIKGESSDKKRAPSAPGPRAQPQGNAPAEGGRR